MLNDSTHHTMANLMPMQWLLGSDLSAETKVAIGDWVHQCYLPSLQGTLEGSEARAIEDFLPWGDSPIRRVLPSRSVVPGAQTGITFLRGPLSGNTTPCDVYLDAVQMRVETWLAQEQRTPRGDSLGGVIEQQEMLNSMDAAVPAPSLTGVYLALRGVSVLGSAAGGSASTGITGVLKQGFSSALLFLGAGLGAAQGLGNEFQRVIDGLSWIVGLAVFLTWWMPYMLGLAHLVLDTFFVFVVLMAMWPNTQYQPLGVFFTAKLFLCSAPIWWALADQAQRLAATIGPRSDDVLLGLGTSAMAYGRSTWIAVLCLLLIPPLTSAVLFLGFRGLSGLMRSPM